MPDALGTRTICLIFVEKSQNNDLIKWFNETSISFVFLLQKTTLFHLVLVVTGKSETHPKQNTPVSIRKRLEHTVLLFFCSLKNNLLN